VAETCGAYVGGHARPENRVADRIDRRRSETRSGKRRVVVVMRERRGRILAQVFAGEDAVPTRRQRIAQGTRVPADQSPAQSPASPACAAASLGAATISPAPTSSATRRRPQVQRTCAGSATASRPTAASAWRCEAAHRSMSAAPGNARKPPSRPATRPRRRPRRAASCIARRSG